MDFGFDVITAEEYERQHALYGPLTQALRKLIAAQPKFTGTITLRYLRGTPLGPLCAEAFIKRTEGVKTFAGGYLSDADGTTVEAEGVFIRPAWARDAG